MSSHAVTWTTVTWCSMLTRPHCMWVPVDEFSGCGLTT
ncbi:unnamed protein product [Nippostrongylus brasiliensis]|uniref:Uncharacterized protein n=1 Tax=Nippostrongylus brasiliensis TaxID=27835 RepID=A0A0N4XN78_NIPBR|nr:unnamed protein product [Nippostrongylus brasiliensis]